MYSWQERRAMAGESHMIPDEAPLKNLVWYFDAQVFAFYRSEPHKYILTDDYFEGHVRATDAYYNDPVVASQKGSLDVLFGYRTLRSGELAVVAWFPDLDKLPEGHKRR